MMTTRIFLSVALLAALISCTNSKTEETKVGSEKTEAGTADVKQLMASFDDTWNKKDSAGLVNMLADDALLISGRETMNGKKEIADRWVHHNMPIAGNLKLTSLQDNAGADLGVSTGTWSVDATLPGKPVSTSTGNHTFVWKKAAGGAWKLALLNMEDHDPK